jgi:hypothetical protein
MAKRATLAIAVFAALVALAAPALAATVWAPAFRGASSEPAGAWGTAPTTFVAVHSAHPVP